MWGINNPTHILPSLFPNSCACRIISFFSVRFFRPQTILNVTFFFYIKITYLERCAQIFRCEEDDVCVESFTLRITYCITYLAGKKLSKKQT